MHKAPVLIALSLFATVAPANSETATALQDDIPLDAYLDTLGRIAPAARAGTDAYLIAFQRRCGRSLTAIELRRAIADGAGEPVLIAMMLAASRHDTAALQRLSRAVSCMKRR